MILTEVARYLAQRRRATIAEIALHFGIEEDAARGMVEIWIGKGRVTRTEGYRCSTCTGCVQAVPEIYFWQGPDPADRRDRCDPVPAG
jgi:hypothetical protein